MGDKKKANCSSCKRITNCEVVGAYSQYDDFWHGIYDVSEGCDYHILKCLGCEHVFYQSESWFSENTTKQFCPNTNEWENQLDKEIEQFPKLKRDLPTWLQDLAPFKVETSEERVRLKKTMMEIYKTFNHGFHVGCGILIRTAFELFCIDQGADKNSSFEEKLSYLNENQIIAHRQKNYLKILVDAGNAVAHRGFYLEEKELSILIDTLEALLKENYFTQKHLKKLSQRIPKRDEV